MSVKYRIPLMEGMGTRTDLRDKKAVIASLVRKMYLKTNSMFMIDGIPDTINKRLMEFQIQRVGFTIITEVKDSEIRTNKRKYKSGLYAFTEGVGLGGEMDQNYMPTIATIANPAMGLSVQRKIGEDCVLIRNDFLLDGIDDINSRYATMIAENLLTMQIYNVLSRAPKVFSSPDAKVAKTFEQYMHDLEDGKIGCVLDTIIDNWTITGSDNIPSTDRMQHLVEYEQYLEASWLNELGINASYNMKREALNSSETNVNRNMLLPLIDQMFECQHEDFGKVNEMYKTKIRIEYNSAWREIQEEVTEDVEENETESQDDNIGE